MDTNHLMPSTSKSTSSVMNGEDVPRFKATTIGTVVVRSGPIQMVIALLQVGLIFVFKFEYFVREILDNLTV